MPLVEVLYSDIEFYERLGTGSFGSVYRGLWKSQAKEVAVKRMFTLEKEAEVLSILSHKNIVQFYGAVVISPNYCLLTEYAKLGSLFEYLSKNILHFRKILDWAKDIASGINYLHNEAPLKIIHRDLKSKNVVITSDFTVKLCDFGSSRVLSQSTHMTMTGTLPWMAPEVIQSKPVSEKCDAFSYGVVLWELLTSEAPFKGFEVVQVAWLVVVKEERLVIPDKCPPAFARMMKKCWTTDPELRPDFVEIRRVLDTMDEDGTLEEETNSFIDDKDNWKEKMEITLIKLKELEKNLVMKEQELAEREVQVSYREKRLSQQHELPNTMDLQEWTENDVHLWMQQLGNEEADLVQYSELFLNNHINGKRLMKLNIEALKVMGIYSYGHRMDLADQITKLRDELDHLLHFPPLELAPPDQSPPKLKTIPLTLLFGNHCRLGATMMDHKWKMFLEVDGEDQALTCIKDVTFHLQSTITFHTVTQPPYVMDRWQSAGSDNRPIIVECVVTYEGKVKKPKSTKHTHEVILKEGGSVFQKSVQLTLKLSAGGSVSSPGDCEEEEDVLGRSSGVSSTASTRSQVSYPPTSGSTMINTPDTWASKVRQNGFPRCFSPRPISVPSQEVIMRKKEKDMKSDTPGRGSLSKSASSPVPKSPLPYPIQCRQPLFESSKKSTAETSKASGSAGILQQADGEWQVVGSNRGAKVHQTQHRTPGHPLSYQRSRSDNPSSSFTKGTIQARKFHSEGDQTRFGASRGTGYTRGKTKGRGENVHGPRRK